MVANTPRVADMLRKEMDEQQPTDRFAAIEFDLTEEEILQQEEIRKKTVHTTEAKVVTLLWLEGDEIMWNKAEDCSPPPTHQEEEEIIHEVLLDPEEGKETIIKRRIAEVFELEPIECHYSNGPAPDVSTIPDEILERCIYLLDGTNVEELVEDDSFYDYFVPELKDMLIHWRIEQYFRLQHYGSAALPLSINDIDRGIFTHRSYYPNTNKALGGIMGEQRKKIIYQHVKKYSPAKIIGQAYQNEIDNAIRTIDTHGLPLSQIGLY